MTLGDGVEVFLAASSHGLYTAPQGGFNEKYVNPPPTKQNIAAAKSHRAAKKDGY